MQQELVHDHVHDHDDGKDRAEDPAYETRVLRARLEG
jgi:hypothetical protein